MGFFGNLFKKKKGTEKVEEPQKQIPSPLPQDEWVCEYCRGSIDCGERWSKFDGKYYHKACFKLIKRGAFNGN